MRRLIAALCVICAMACADVRAQRIAEPALHALIQQGIDCAGRQKYAEARAMFAEAIRRFPEHPAGYLQQAVLLEVISLDCETPVPQPEFNTLLSRAGERAERLLARDAQSVDGNYYAGMVHSYIAYYTFRDGENWISGLQHGMKATSFLQRCLDRQPAACDAMIGVGTYKYWKSRKMSLLTWTPLVDDERAAGIALLRKAESCALYSAGQAANSLVWIYIEEERWDDAMRAAWRMLARFPDNRLFLWGLASAAEKKGDLRCAIDAYQGIVRSVNGDVHEARYILLQARAKIARLSFEAGDRNTARRECAWVLANRNVPLSRFTSDGRDRIERRIEDMEDLWEELTG